MRSAGSALSNWCAGHLGMAGRRIVLECKLRRKRDAMQWLLEQSLKKTRDYMDCNGTTE